MQRGVSPFLPDTRPGGSQSTAPPLLDCDPDHNPSGSDVASICDKGR
jgi:hypothetical protein